MRERRHLPHRTGGLTRGPRQAGGIRPAGLAALLLAAAGILVLLKLFLPPAPAPAASLASSTQCLECHPGVAAEWKPSHHAFAFENPEVRKLSQDFQNEECLACHAPRPVLAFAPGERVLSRNSERTLGVDCLACHALPGGGVATADPHPDVSAPCRPVFTPRMEAVEHCAACHNQHKTVDQWRAAPESLRGRDCLGCHMPETPRAGGKTGRSHRFPGGHSLEALQRAVKLEAGRDAAGPWVRITNAGAAHNFPTDERSRAADLQVRWKTATGWGAWQRLWRMRDPYRDEVDLTNTQLPAGQSWQKTLVPPEGASAGAIRLLYRTNPFQPDAEATEVGRVSITP